MARIRTIKPEYFTSLTIADLSLHARLTFIGLWTHVDDAGRCVDDSRLIKAAVWPLDDRVSADVERDLHELTEASLIVRYTVDERSYIAVRTWDEHQRINRPTPSKLPAPPPTPPNGPPPGRKATSEADQPAETEAPPASEPDRSENSRTPHAQLTEDSLPERKGKEGKGREGNYPSALAPLDASEGDPPAEVIDAEIVPDPPTGPPPLFVVPDPVRADLAVPEPVNAGLINRQWIDFCKANQVRLTNSHIKRYGAAIKRALGEGFDPELVKRALGEMLRDRVTSRPALFDNYLIRVQQGPELPPRRASRTESSMATPGGSTAALIRDALTRPA